MSYTRIFYYHVIADSQPDIYPNGISPARFVNQITWLKRLGWQFISLSRALNSANGDSVKRICITLDDGFAINYPILMQLMQKHGIQPTLFLIGKCLDNKALAWNHKLILLRRYVNPQKLDQQIGKMLPGADQSKLFAKITMQEKDQLTDRLWLELLPWTQAEYLARNKPFLSTEQLQNLLESGAELALHSQTHPDFSRLDHQTAYSEIQANLQAMENLKLPFQRILAYPYGRCADKAVESFLHKELQIAKFLGTRYVLGDNSATVTRWQRQNLEQAAGHNLTEFFAKPQLRKLTEYL